MLSVFFNKEICNFCFSVNKLLSGIIQLFLSIGKLCTSIRDFCLAVCNFLLFFCKSTFESLGIDSLDIVEMLMDLESELGIELEMEDQKITTFQELADFIESKVN